MKSKLKQVSIMQTSSKTKEELEKELQEEGFSNYEWADMPGAYYSPHSHEYDECISVISGKMTFYINEEEYELSLGKKLYLPAGTVHESKNKSNERVTYLIGELI